MSRREVDLMALNLKNSQVERLVEEVAEMAGETKTEAVRKSLEERKARLQIVRDDDAQDLRRYLREEVWPQVLPEYRGRAISQEEQDEILGYGPGGVCSPPSHRSPALAARGQGRSAREFTWPQRKRREQARREWKNCGSAQPATVVTDRLPQSEAELWQYNSGPPQSRGNSDGSPAIAEA